MPERQIEQRAEDRGHNTYKVFAEWLREHHKAIEKRLDRQDSKLEQIFGEVKRTNGRVTDLEKSVELQTAINRERSAWEGELDAKAKRRWTSRERVLGLAVAAFTAVGALHEAFHLF